MKILSQNVMMTAAVVFAILMVLSPIATNGADTTTTGGTMDFDGILSTLATQCPTEVARLKPCLSDTTEVSACTECVSAFISQNQIVLNAASRSGAPSGSTTTTLGHRRQQGLRQLQGEAAGPDGNTLTGPGAGGAGAATPAAGAADTGPDASAGAGPGAGAGVGGPGANNATTAAPAAGANDEPGSAAAGVGGNTATDAPTAGAGGDTTTAAPVMEGTQDPTDDASAFSSATAPPTESTTTTTTTATTTTGGNDSGDICGAVETTICDGIETCADSCGLVVGGAESFLTFGSTCEGLFAILMTCVLQAEDVVTQCQDLEGTTVSTTTGSGAAAASSAAPDALSITETTLLRVLMYTAAAAAVSILWGKE